MRKCKKRAAAFLFAAALICSLTVPFGSAAATNPSVMVDGKAVQFSSDMGIPFVDSNNRTQVPLRAAMEAMGAKVEWDAEVRTAVVTKGYVTVRVPIGAEFVWINSEKKTNDTAAVIVNSRTYLPIRIVAEALGADVGWDGNTKTVKITTHGDPVVWVRTGVSWYDGKYTDSIDYNIDNQGKAMSIYGEYIFNNRGQLESKVSIDEGPDPSLITEYTYNNMGCMTYCISSQTDLQGGEEAFPIEEAWYEYNTRGDVTKVLFHTLYDDHWEQLDCTYTYDKAGRISKMIIYIPTTRGRQDVPPDRVIHVFKYDSFDRIIEVQTESIYNEIYGFPESKILVKYEYDSYGNLVQRITQYLPREDDSYSSCDEERFSYRQFDPTTMNPDCLLFPLSKDLNMIGLSEYLEPNALPFGL